MLRVVTLTLVWPATKLAAEWSDVAMNSFVSLEPGLVKKAFGTNGTSKWLLVMLQMDRDHVGLEGGRVLERAATRFTLVLAFTMHRPAVVHHSLLIGKFFLTNVTRHFFLLHHMDKSLVDFHPIMCGEKFTTKGALYIFDFDVCHLKTGCHCQAGL